MAKKVQMSTVELVVKALTDKGYCVDDVELDKGVVTVAALAPHGSTLLDSFKQTEARKWLDSVPDMSIVDVEPELTVEEWEQQYGSLTDNEIQDAILEQGLAGEPVAVAACTVAYGEPGDPEIIKQLLAEEVEPAADVAPETPEGEDEMSEEVKGVGCWKCGVIFEPEKAALDEWGNSGQPFEPTDWTCPECEDLERLADEATVKEAREKEENLYTQYMAVREPYFDENPDLAMVFEAMLYRRWLYVRYQTDYTNGTSVIRDRKWLPSHVYQASSTGGVCVVAFDVCKKNGREERSIKTFRIDKIRGAHLGEIAPAAAGDAVTIYPAAYEVRRAMPQRVKNPANYIASGKWSSKPLPQVLTN